MLSIVLIAKEEAACCGPLFDVVPIYHVRAEYCTFKVGLEHIHVIQNRTFDVSVVPSAVVPVTARRRAPATGMMPSKSRSTESVVGLIPVFPFPPISSKDE